jgi:hypothetical protein
MISNVEILEQGGRGVFKLDPDAPAYDPENEETSPFAGPTFEAEGRAYGFELVILSEEATFEELVGSADFPGLEVWQGVPLPRGSYRWRFTRAKITTGLAMVLNT